MSALSNPTPSAENVANSRCSVEKQLGVYWVLRLLVKYRQTDDISRIVELKEVNLLEHEASATVFIDHLPCDK